MKAFAELFLELDRTTKTGEKVAALVRYLQSAPKKDRVWTIALLSGKRPKRCATSTELRIWAAEVAGLPLWLFEESYAVTGDLAETISLVLPEPVGDQAKSLTETMDALMDLTGRSEDVRKAAALLEWSQLRHVERFVFNKLLTGGFRMGVSQGLVRKALAQSTGIEESALAQRLMGNWEPKFTEFDALVSGKGDNIGRPYPFALASPLESSPEALGTSDDWAAEWKWDGIRGQLVLRNQELFVWSRGEELLTDRFPEFSTLVDFIPAGTVLDGEILGWNNGRPLPFADLQKRIGRKTVPKRLLAEAPIRFVAYDLLESEGVDLRARPFSHRRKELESIINHLPTTLPIHVSPLVQASGWEGLAEHRRASRDNGAEGLMLKLVSSPYFTGRQRGDWWKWKVDPYTIDAVMIYAQSGHGRRANLYSDFTFALRNGNDLTPFAKAYSGLTDAEFSEITRWVQKNSLEKFGPVRRVPPELVFELAFEGLQESSRHKSGIAVRFPRILRWRKDKTVADIDTMDGLRALLNQAGKPN